MRMRNVHWRFFRAMPRRHIMIKITYVVILGMLLYFLIRDVGYEPPPIMGETEHMQYKRSLRSKTNKLPEDISSQTNGTRTRGIYFLKVHKSGSTTLQNIFYRYALSNNLKVATYDMPFGMPYPDTPKPKYLFEDITQPGFKRYDMICDHAIYSEHDVQDYMVPQYDSVAIVREPFSHLQSAFSFFRLDRRFELTKEKDPLRAFIQNPLLYENNDNFKKYIHNMQSFHFGIPRNLEDEKEIQNKIEKISNNFTAVLISNRFDESILMMKRILNFSMKDILYMKQFVGTKGHTSRYTETTLDAFRLIHRRLTPSDYMLYNFFNNKLNAYIYDEGASFHDELEYFQHLNERVNEFCSGLCAYFDDHTNMTLHDLKEILEYDFTVDANEWHDTLTVAYRDCIYMQLWTFHYQRAFTVNQVESVCLDDNGRDSIFSHVPAAVHGIDNKEIWCDKDSFALFTFPKSVILESIKGSSSDHVTRSKMC